MTHVGESHLGMSEYKHLHPNSFIPTSPTRTFHVFINALKTLVYCMLCLAAQCHSFIYFVVVVQLC